VNGPYSARDREDDGPPAGAFLRPFVGPLEAAAGDSPSAQRAHAGAAGPEPAEAAAVRPYGLTGGRVASADGRLRVETMVRADGAARHRLRPHAHQHRALVELARVPTSVAELAGASGLAVGVVLVLVGDLARGGLVELSTPAVSPRDDVILLRRLIDGVAAL
jgi:hypothetical protein